MYIINIQNGGIPTTGVYNLIDYLQEKNETSEIILSQFIDVNKKDVNKITQDFTLQADRNSNIANPICHLSFSFHPDDKNLLEQQEEAILEAILNKFSNNGIDIQNNQFIIYKHNDKNHPHYHLVFNRVGIHKETIKDNFINEKCKTIAQEITSDFNLKIGKVSIENKTYDRDSNISKNNPFIEGILSTLKDSKNVDDFQKKLSAKNVFVTFKKNSKGTIENMYFSPTSKIEDRVAGNLLHKSLSWKKIIQYFNQQQNNSTQNSSLSPSINKDDISHFITLIEEHKNINHSTIKEFLNQQNLSVFINQKRQSIILKKKTLSKNYFFNITSKIPKELLPIIFKKQYNSNYFTELNYVNSLLEKMTTMEKSIYPLFYEKLKENNIQIRLSKNKIYLQTPTQKLINIQSTTLEKNCIHQLLNSYAIHNNKNTQFVSKEAGNIHISNSSNIGKQINLGIGTGKGIGKKKGIGEEKGIN